MFNIGVTELLCFAIIALLVLGPEKLPEAARFSAKWYGKAKRFIQSIQNEVESELNLAEFRKEIQKEIARMTEIEQRLQKQLTQITGQHPVHQPDQLDVSLHPPFSKTRIYHPFNLKIIPFQLHFFQPHLLSQHTNTSQRLHSEWKIAV